MEGFFKFIGRDKILEEGADLKVIMDHIRQYPVVVFFIVAISMSNPEGFVEALVFGISVLTAFLIGACVLTQSVIIGIAFIGKFTNLSENRNIKNAAIFMLYLACMASLFFSLLRLLLRYIPN